MSKPRLMLTGACVALVCAVLFSAAAALGADAQEEGWLYVAAHLDPDTPEQGVQHSLVFVYDAEGVKIPGGGPDGAWDTARTIALPPGRYWVGVSTRESKHTLRCYQVEANTTTVIETGWVSVATIAESKQPTKGCFPWDATLMAYVEAEGELHLVATNAGADPDGVGALQLLPGDYVIEFHGMRTPVEVQARSTYRLPLGRVKASDEAEDATLVRSLEEAKGDGLPLCLDGPIEVFPGDYFVREVIAARDRDDVREGVRPIKVEAVSDGKFGYRTVAKDQPRGAKRSPAADEGLSISREQCKTLTRWGEKKSEFADLEMFADPL